LTAEIIQKLFEAGEYGDCRNGEKSSRFQVLPTTWFCISLYFGKRDRENQSLMKKSMLRLADTASGE